MITANADPESAGTYPGLVDVAFQCAFAMITTAIITGSLAGRMKFGAVCLFVTIWVIVVYAPLAHMVWGGDGSLIGDMIGALDFAGGDVVHISSGLTGLILCLILGKRREFGMMSYRPHNVPFVALGAALLWFGWFGFNSGSQFTPDGVAALAMVNTVTASAAALLSWLIIDRIKAGKPTLVGAATGLVAGLVVITPAAGFVEPWAALIMGLIVSPICYFAISFLKKKIGYDDALDAFGCHAVGGITGGILTGIFCVPELSWHRLRRPDLHRRLHSAGCAGGRHPHHRRVCSGGRCDHRLNCEGDLQGQAARERAGRGNRPGRRGSWRERVPGVSGS